MRLIQVKADSGAVDFNWRTVAVCNRGRTAMKRVGAPKAWWKERVVWTYVALVLLWAGLTVVAVA